MALAISCNEEYEAARADISFGAWITEMLFQPPSVDSDDEDVSDSENWIRNALENRNSRLFWEKSKETFSEPVDSVLIGRNLC